MLTRKKALLASAIAILGILIVAVVAFFNSSVPTSAPSGVDRNAQIIYEAELSAFLEANPQPSQADFDQTVDGQNAYWRTMVDWWEAVPWDAVAGQWGCQSSTQAVEFHPPDEAGVISASHGGVGTCTDASLVRTFPGVFTLPETRTSIIQESPDQFRQRQ